MSDPLGVPYVLPRPRPAPPLPQPAALTEAIANLRRPNRAPHPDADRPRLPRLPAGSPLRPTRGQLDLWGREFRGDEHD
jgi:hypothetical protein